MMEDEIKMPIPGEEMIYEAEKRRQEDGFCEYSHNGFQVDECQGCRDTNYLNCDLREFRKFQEEVRGRD